MNGLVLLALTALGGADQGPSFFGGYPLPIDRAEDDSWIAVPSREGAPTARDLVARKTLKKLAEKDQSPQFRQSFSIELSDKPTGLPDDYDILMYGQWHDRLRMLMEVRVRGECATAEMVTADGFYRGPLPAQTIDHLARQLACAFQARHVRKPQKKESQWGRMTESYCSIHDVRYQRIELISRDPGRPFHLRTEPWQLTAYNVQIQFEGVRGFAHTRFGEQVEQIAREKLTLVKPSDELRREVVARLRRIEEPKKPAANDDDGDPTSTSRETPAWAVPQEELPLDHVDRNDLASIAAKLHARLAVHWQLEEALPEVRRLGLNEAAIRLAIVTADDPTELLKAGLCIEDDELRNEDDDLFEWSLDFSNRLAEEEKVELLLFALPRVECGYRSRSVLSELLDSQLGGKQLAKIEEFYNQTQDPRAKVAAARCLLHKTDRDEYYGFLSRQALNWPKSIESTGIFSWGAEYNAFNALVYYSVKQAKRRDETAAIVRGLFERMPEDPTGLNSGFGRLISALGDLKYTGDVDLLSQYSERDDSLASTAIMALANIRPDLALEKAHAQIHKYLNTGGSFEAQVQAYFDLILWQNDASAVELLARARAKHGRETQDLAKRNIPVYRGDYGAQALIDYLNAKTVDERVKRALEYPREQNLFAFNPNHDRWLKEVGLQLIREGADPKRCAPLLKPMPLPPISREHDTWTSE